MQRNFINTLNTFSVMIKENINMPPFVVLKPIILSNLINRLEATNNEQLFKSRLG